MSLVAEKLELHANITMQIASLIKACEAYGAAAFVRQANDHTFTEVTIRYLGQVVAFVSYPALIVASRERPLAPDAQDFETKEAYEQAVVEYEKRRWGDETTG